MKKLYFAIFLLVLSFVIKAQTSHDCISAIPICFDVYDEDHEPNGEGGSVEYSQCSGGEFNSNWYIFTAQQSTEITFTITPGNSSDDYDWAIYDITDVGCEQLALAPGDAGYDPTVEISCNFSITAGNTGTRQGETATHQDDQGTPWNAPFNIVQERQYVIYLSSFGGNSGNGYNINFSNASAMVDHSDPHFTDVTPIPSCGDDTIVIKFSERVECASLTASELELTGPGEPYTITNLICNSGTDYSQFFTLVVSPAISGGGQYTVTLTGDASDACGNTVSGESFNFNVSGVSASANVSQQVACYDSSDGSAIANATGGTAPYEYLWSNSANTSSISNLSNGTYTVTVTDATGNCFDTSSVTITQPTAITINGILKQEPACNDSTDGQLSVDNPSGGTPGYTYHWSSGANTQIASGLGAGTNYAVTVSDSHGCKFIKNNIHLNQPSALTNNNNITDVTCHGSSNGSIATNVSGGTAPYSYVWSANTAGQTGAIANNLDADTFSLIITDDHDCKLVYNNNIIVSEDPSIIITETINHDATCGNSDGTSTVSATGGSGSGYTYIWNITPSQSGETLSNVSSGSYIVTVTDSHSCSDSLQININDASAPIITEITTSHINVLCHGDSTGIAEISATGGTAPLNYYWSSSSNTATTETNLAAGQYTAFVVDANNCVSSMPINITEPDELHVIIYSSTDASCNGYNDGQAIASSSGGPVGTDYSYQWNAGGSTDSVANINLQAGTYTVTVTDDNNCTTQKSITIAEPTAISIDTTDFTNPLCFGDDDGTASIVFVSGGTSGTGNYSYLWNNGQTGQTAVNLQAGEYIVTVTDDHNCFDTITITLTQPTLLESSLSITSILCYGDNTGSATITGNGGTLPYTYSWSHNNLTNNIADDLLIGDYWVTITDDHNCFNVDSFTITGPTMALDVASNFTNPTCYNDSTGEISLSVQGGTPDYSYYWSNGETSQNLNEISAGTYSVTVSDNNSCTEALSITLVNPDFISIVDSIYYEDFLGNILLNVSGGTPDYTYLWSNGQTGNLIEDLSSGYYSVTITDANGCVYADNDGLLFKIDVPLIIPSVITPNADGKNDRFRITNIGAFEQVDIKIFSRWGNLLFSYSGTGKGYEDTSKQWDGFINNKELPFGSYVYLIKLNNDKDNTYSGSVTIVR